MIICEICDTHNRVGAKFCQKCGTELYNTLELLPETLAQGRYKVLGLLGRGGMGAVYRVEDQRLAGKILALKEMSNPFVTNPQKQVQALETFQQEAQMLARLKHPNIPDITDFFSESEHHYIVMELVPGETLDKRLERQQAPCTEAQVRDWALQLCDVLAYLHEQNPPIIFRDLKPSNIMLTPAGRIKLIDFGIARFFKPGKGSDTWLMGTPGFAPAEQWGQGQTDARSDIYSLGVVMHYLLTRHDPRPNFFLLPPVRQLNPAVSPQLEQVIQQATQPRSEARYQSINQMRDALAADSSASTVRQSDFNKPFPPSPNSPYYQPYPPPPPPPPPPNHPPKEEPPAKGRSVWAIALVVLLLLGGSLVGAGLIMNALLDTDSPTATEVVFVPPLESTTTNTPQKSQTPLIADSDGSQPPSIVVSPSSPAAEPPTVPPPSTATPSSPTVEPSPTESSSSSGGQFAYTSCAGENCDIYLWNFATNSSLPLTQDDAIDKQPAWAPTGQELVFVSNRSGSTEELFRYDLASQQVVEQLSGGPDYKAWPAWSPDGTQILYQKYNDATGVGPQIWSLSLALNQARQLTQPTPGWNKTAQWGNGAQIVFSAAPGDTNGDGFVSDNDQRYIYMMDSAGNDLRALTNDPAFYDMYPYFLPDGIHLVFSRHAKADEFTNNGPGELYLLNINSGELRALTFTSSDEVMARPEPNGNQFLIVRNEGNGNNIYLSTWDGTQLGSPVFIVAGDVPAWNPAK